LTWRLRLISNAAAAWPLVLVGRGV